MTTTDTPRTDAARFEALRGAALRQDCIPLKLGEELERELNASKAEVERLKANLRRAIEIAEDSNDSLMDWDENSRCEAQKKNRAELNQLKATLFLPPSAMGEVNGLKILCLQRENARLQMELDGTCNAEELRQEREARQKAEAEVERLREWIRSEWPADQAEEIINSCKSK